LQLRRSLRASGKITFNAFDIAVRRYWELSYPEDNIQEALKDVVDDASGIFIEVAGSVEDAPAGIGLKIKILNYLRRKASDIDDKRTIECSFYLAWRIILLCQKPNHIQML